MLTLPDILWDKALEVAQMLALGMVEQAAGDMEVEEEGPGEVTFQDLLMIQCTFRDRWVVAVEIQQVATEVEEEVSIIKKGRLLQIVLSALRFNTVAKTN